MSKTIIIEKRGVVTYGDVIRTIFPDIEPVFQYKDKSKYILDSTDYLSPSIEVFNSWWDSPYREE